jgi:hypothetical protein
MTVHTILPRGIRNNNPLNIRLNPDNAWQGKVPPKHNSDGAFEQFEDPIMGLRAAAVLLIAHYDRRHLDTIRKLWRCGHRRTRTIPRLMRVASPRKAASASTSRSICTTTTA